MEYYINPSWFYWLNVVDSLRFFIIITSAIFGACALAWVLTTIMNEDEIDKKQIMSIVILILIIILAIFIPSRDTMVEMQIASLATKQNITNVYEDIKNIVDYIVQSVSNIK